MSARSVRPGSSNQKGAPRSSKAASSRPAAERLKPSPRALPSLSRVVWTLWPGLSIRLPVVTLGVPTGETAAPEVERSLAIAGGVGIATTLVAVAKSLVTSSVLVS